MTHFLSSLKSPRKLFRTLLLALLAVGCAGQAHAFSGLWEYSWGTMNDSSLDIETFIDRTCFLSGMAGNLVPDGPSGGDNGAGVEVFMTAPENDYLLKIYTTNSPLGAFARCVNTDAGRTYQQHWQTAGGGMSKVKLAAVTPKKRCFLTGVGASSNAQGKRGFQTNTDNVRVTHDDHHWYLGGNQSGPAWATALCIDINEDHQSWQWQAGDPGTRKDPLALDTGGVTCLLTGIGGHFDQDDWADGVFVSKAAGSAQFYLNTKNGKTGWVNCVK
jgi:hypothetical protein